MKYLLTPLKPLTLMALFVFSQASFASIEQGMAWLQQGERDLALEAMQPEIDAQDPVTLFWQARIYMKMGGMETFKIGDILLRSAEQGNPWAMINLVESTYEHCRFFMLPCDDKWFDKAIEKWQELAANGDGKAMFMLAKHKDTWRKYVPYLAHRTRVAQYEQALKMGANQAAIALSSELRNHQDIKDPAVIEQALGYLKIAADRGYAPAMTEFYNFYESIGMDKVEPYLEQALSLGYAEGAFHLAMSYERKEHKTQSDWVKIYKYFQLTEKLNGLSDHTRTENRARLPAEVADQVDLEIADFLTKVKPNRFYDETNLY